MKEYGKEVKISLILIRSVPGKLYVLIKVHREGNLARSWYQ